MSLCTCTGAESVKVAEDPTRTRPGSHGLVPIDTKPVVAETPLTALRSWLTPTPLFYVRNHFDIPEIDASAWSLSIGGAVSDPVEISYSELVRLPGKTVPAMMSGIYWGYVSLIEGMVKRIKIEFGSPMTVIATGGLSPLFSPAIDAIETIDTDLTLRGLFLIYQRNRST